MSERYRAVTSHGLSTIWFATAGASKRNARKAARNGGGGGATSKGGGGQHRDGLSVVGSEAGGGARHAGSGTHKVLAQSSSATALFKPVPPLLTLRVSKGSLISCQAVMHGVFDVSHRPLKPDVERRLAARQ